MPDSPLVILFSIDGMRPDALTQANTPVIDSLIASGASTMNARTVMPSVTLPCHTSMHRGVDVARHGITTNLFMPLARPVPSVFDVAAMHGRNAAFFCNWPELRDLCSPGSLRYAYFAQQSSSGADDWLIARSAASHLKADSLDLLFVYFGWTDSCGHAHGWMSPEQIAAIENADSCIGTVLAAAAEGGRGVVSLVQSDHGGHERTHGTESPEDMTIPWILSGPGVRKGHAITGQVRIFDTCPTLARAAGLPAAPEWEGRAIDEAFEG